MKQTHGTIDYDWLTRPTGDPFADVGGYVIKYLSETHPEKSVMELIEDMAKVYVNKWGAKINTFFLNSPITQPAFKGEVKIKETIKYFTSLLDGALAGEEGCCRISGRKTKLFKAGRDNSLMSGSGTFVNFHHGFQLGMMLSREMIIRMFFVPYGTISVGGRIAIIHSNKHLVNEFFVRNNCEKNEENIAMSFSDGVLKSDFGMPANALFRFVDDLFTSKLDVLEREEKENLSLTLYHFSNFGASPEIVIYRLPTSVFRFYSTCQKVVYNKDWRTFVLAHYTNSKFKGAELNRYTLNYELIKKDEVQQINFEEYKVWRNVVLEYLLYGKSLLPIFFRWSKKHEFNFNIIQLYQKEIRFMKQETLDKIKELAVFLTAADTDVIKKTIKALNGYKSAYELRRFFLKNVVEKNYREGASEAKITVEDMVYYLFPDDVSWRDIRLLLLIAIYQELHGKKIWIDGELLEEEEEVVTED